MALLLLLSRPVLAADIYVATDGSDTVGTGAQTAPYSTLQKAVDAAANGDTLHLAAGTYYPAGTTVVGKGLTIAGAGRGATVIDGSQAVRWDEQWFPTEDGGFEYRDVLVRCTILRVSAYASSAVVQDLSMRNGMVEAPEYGAASGGGAIQAHSNLTVQRCDFTGCSAITLIGGAIVNTDHLTLEECVFEDNVARTGAAVASIFASGNPVITATGCRFVRNSAVNRMHDYASGGAVSAYRIPTTLSASGTSRISLVGCYFEGNSNQDLGGNDHCIVYNTCGYLSVAGCTFIRNSATPIYAETCVIQALDPFTGGPVLGAPTATRVDGCRFFGNYGAVGTKAARLEVCNSSFVGNVANLVNSEGLCTTNVLNCTFDSNSYGQATLYAWVRATMSVANCILMRSASTSFGAVAALSSDGRTIMIAGSDIQGWEPAANILDAGGNLPGAPDPMFVRNPSPGPDGVWRTADDDYGDLRLRPGSPCIDAGSNASVPYGMTTGIFGLPRFVDDPLTPDAGMGVAPIIDMGAHEYVPVEALAASVRTIIAAGAALPAGGQPLFAKLNAATACAASSDKQGVVDALTAFCNQVRALAKTGKLTRAQSDGLLAQAEALLAGWRA